MEEAEQKHRADLDLLKSKARAAIERLKENFAKEFDELKGQGEHALRETKDRLISAEQSLAQERERALGLTEALHMARGQGSGALGEIARLGTEKDDTIAALSEENKTLKHQLIEAQASMEGSEESENLRLELRNVRGELEKSESTRKHAEEQLMRVTDAAKAEVMRLRQALKDSGATKSEAGQNAELETLKSTNASLEQKMQLLAERAKTEVVRLRTELAVAKEKQAFLASSSSSPEQIEELKASLSAAHVAQEQDSLERVRLERETMEKSEIVQNLESEKAQLSEKLENVSQAARVEITRLREELSKSGGNSDDLHAGHLREEELRVAIAQLQMQNNVTSVELNENQRISEELRQAQIETLQREKMELESALENAKTSDHSIKTRGLELENALEAVRVQAMAAEETIQANERRIEELIVLSKRQTSSLLQEKQDLERSLEEIQTRVAGELEAARMREAESIAALQAASSSADQSAGQEKNQLEERLQKLKEVAKAQIEKLNAEKQALEEELQSTQAKVTDGSVAAAEIQQLLLEKKELTSVLEEARLVQSAKAVQDATSSQNAEEMERLIRELNESRESNEKLHVKLIELKEKAKAEILKLREEKQHLEQAAEEARNQAAAAAAGAVANGKSNEEITSLRSDLESASAREVELQNTLEEANLVAGNAESTRRALDEALERTRDMKTQIALLKTERDDLINALDDAKMNLTMTMAKVIAPEETKQFEQEEEIKTLHLNLQATGERAKQAEDQFEQLKQIAKERFETLQNENESLQKALEETKSNHNFESEDVEYLRAAVEQANAASRFAEEELQRIKETSMTEIETLRMEKDALESAVVAASEKSQAAKAGSSSDNAQKQHEVESTEMIQKLEAKLVKLKEVAKAEVEKLRTEVKHLKDQLQEMGKEASGVAAAAATSPVDMVEFQAAVEKSAKLEETLLKFKEIATSEVEKLRAEKAKLMEALEIARDQTASPSNENEVQFLRIELEAARARETSTLAEASLNGAGADPALFQEALDKNTQLEENVLRLSEFLKLETERLTSENVVLTEALQAVKESMANSNMEEELSMLRIELEATRAREADALTAMPSNGVAAADANQLQVTQERCTKLEENIGKLKERAKAEIEKLRIENAALVAAQSGEGGLSGSSELQAALERSAKAEDNFGKLKERAKTELEKLRGENAALRVELQAARETLPSSNNEEELNSLRVELEAAREAEALSAVAKKVDPAELRAALEKSAKLEENFGKFKELAEAVDTKLRGENATLNEELLAAREATPSSNNNEELNLLRAELETARVRDVAAAADPAELRAALEKSAKLEEKFEKLKERAKAELEKLRGENAKLNEDLQAAREAASSSNNGEDLNSLRVELDTARAREAANATGTAVDSAELQAALEKSAKLEESLGNVKHHATAEIEKLRAENAALHQSQESSAQSSGAVSSQAEELRGQIQLMAERNTSLEESLGRIKDAARAEVERLRAENQALLGEVQNSHSLVAETNALRVALDAARVGGGDARLELEATQQRTATLEETLSKFKSAAREQIENLRAELEDAKAAAAALTTSSSTGTVVSRDAVDVSLREQLHEATQKLASMEDKLNRFKLIAKEQMDLLKTENETLKRTLAEEARGGGAAVVAEAHPSSDSLQAIKKQAEASDAKAKELSEKLERFKIAAKGRVDELQSEVVELKKNAQSGKVMAGAAMVPAVVGGVSSSVAEVEVLKSQIKRLESEKMEYENQAIALLAVGKSAGGGSVTGGGNSKELQAKLEIASKALQSERENAKAMAKMSSDAMERVGKERADTKRELESAKEEARKVTKNLNTLKAQLMVTKDEADLLRQNMDNNELAKKHQVEVAKYNEIIKTLEADLGREMARVKELNNELEKTKNYVTRLTDQQLKKGRAEDGELHKRDVEIGRLEAELAQAKVSIVSNETGTADFKKKSREQWNEMQKLQNQVKELQGRLDDASKTEELLRIELEAAMSRNAALAQAATPQPMPAGRDSKADIRQLEEANALAESSKKDITNDLLRARRDYQKAKNEAINALEKLDTLKSTLNKAALLAGGDLSMAADRCDDAIRGCSDQIETAVAAIQARNMASTARGSSSHTTADEFLGGPSYQRRSSFDEYSSHGTKREESAEDRLVTSLNDMEKRLDDMTLQLRHLLPKAKHIATLAVQEKKPAGGGAVFCDFSKIFNALFKRRREKHDKEGAYEGLEVEVMANSKRGGGRVEPDDFQIDIGDD